MSEHIISPDAKNAEHCTGLLRQTEDLCERKKILNRDD